MRRALLLVPLVAISVLSQFGCKSSDERMSFRRRPKQYRSVMSLSPSTTEVLAGSLSFSRLAGRTSADDYPVYMMKQVPVVASTKPDYELMAKLKPDLIIYDQSLYNSEDIKKLSSLGADMYAYNPTSIEEYRRQVYEIANLVGGETHASESLDKVWVELNAASSKLPATAPKVAVLIPSPDGDDMIAGKSSFVADVVKKVGGTPIGPDGSIYVKLSPEMLVSENPDVIIASGSKKELQGVEALIKDPRFQSVAAIKNHRVKVIDSEFLLRVGGRVDQLVRAIYRSVSANDAN